MACRYQHHAYARCRFLVDDFDLLRPGRLDGSSTSLLYPAAHFNFAAVERLRCQPGTRENTLLPLENRDGEVVRPPPPKTNIRTPAAFAHRRHLALHQRESSLFGKNIHRANRLLDYIIRIAPQAKPSCPGVPFGVL